VHFYSFILYIDALHFFASTLVAWKKLLFFMVNMWRIRYILFLSAHFAYFNQFHSWSSTVVSITSAMYDVTHKRICTLLR